MFTTFAGGWPSLVLWMFHRSWHSSVVLGEACALDVNTFLLRKIGGSWLYCTIRRHYFADCNMRTNTTARHSTTLTTTCCMKRHERCHTHA